MNLEMFQKLKIPNAPGVYFFLDTQKKILYIGKATSLRTRIRSYFDNSIHEKRSVLIEKMVREACTVEWEITDSVLEAMLMEANLIRTHKPHYNTRTKDDKSFNHVVITKESFPRVLIVRGKDLANDADSTYSHIFGPFPNGTQFREAMRIIRKLFQFFDGSVSAKAHTTKLDKGKLNFNTQIGLYPKNVSSEAYAQTIRHIRLLFEGKKKQIITELERNMMRAAKKEAFEEAQQLKRRIFALRHIQDIALIRDDLRDYKDALSFRIEAFDVAHLQGDDMTGVMVVVDRGERKQSAYRAFNIQSVKKSHDTQALKETLMRRFKHTEWEHPGLVVVDGGVAQIRIAESVLKQNKLVIPVVGVVKDEHHKPKDIRGDERIIQEYRQQIVLANAESHRFALSLHRKKRRARIK